MPPHVSSPELDDATILRPCYVSCTGFLSDDESNTKWSHVLFTSQPPYLHNLISIQCPRSTRSSSVVTLARTPSSSSTKITDCSFRYASPCLWNQLHFSFRQPHSGTSSSISYSPIPSPITFSSYDSPLCTSITSSLFHTRLKTYLFYKSYPRSFTSFSWTASTDLCLDRFF